MIDLLLRGGTVYDGSGGDPYTADVAIAGDRIAAVTRRPEAGGDAQASSGGVGDAAGGDGAGDDAGTVLDCRGLAVAPGFINVLSHAYVSVLVDPRSLSDLKQGVTTEVFGEGSSMGPWTEAMRDRFVEQQAQGRFDVPWLRLAEYLDHCASTGVAQNVASFIGATTLRINGVGYDNRSATAAELDRMRALVDEEMADGALGIASALIYAPGHYASTVELTELCRAVARHGGVYISHLRSEGDRFLEALDELVTIARHAGVAAEVYHLKAAGQANWPKMNAAIGAIEAARAEGLAITADVYPYTAGGTAVAAAIPPAFHDGGIERLLERLSDPGARRAMRDAIAAPGDGWENLFLASGGGDGVLVMALANRDLHRHQGRTLTEIGDAEGLDPIDALLWLVERDPRAGAAYFIISEDNLRRQLRLPWLSVGSDAQSIAAEGTSLETAVHPRAYGTFARVLGHYARDEGVLSMAEAVRRMTDLPARNLGLVDRGRVAEGAFADIAVFDPHRIIDRATYADPHRYAEGMHHVVVNGTLALRDGEPTGTFAGRALRRGR